MMLSFCFYIGTLRAVYAQTRVETFRDKGINTKKLALKLVVPGADYFEKHHWAFNGC